MKYCCYIQAYFVEVLGGNDKKSTEEASKLSPIQDIIPVEVNVHEDQAAANRLVQTTGQMGVPQANINGEWVLGFDPQRVQSLLKQ